MFACASAVFNKRRPQPMVILHAPMTADSNDVVLPVAGLAQTLSGDWTYSGSGGLLTYSAGPNTNNSWTGTKVDPSLYTGKKVTISANVSIVTTAGSGTGNMSRFFGYSAGPIEVAFSSYMTGGVVHVYSFWYNGGSSNLDLGIMPSSATYSIVWDQSGTNVMYYIDSTLVRTVSEGKYGAATLYVGQANIGNNEITAARYKDIKLTTE